MLGPRIYARYTDILPPEEAARILEIRSPEEIPSATIWMDVDISPPDRSVGWEGSADFVKVTDWELADDGAEDLMWAMTEYLDRVVEMGDRMPRELKAVFEKMVPAALDNWHDDFYDF